MTAITRYLGSASDRLLSPGIWTGFPTTEIQAGAKDGVFEFDDFTSYETVATTVVNAPHGVPVFEGTTAVRGTAGTTQATSHGILELFVTADDEEASLERGGGTSAPYLINNAAGESKKLCFECRVKDSLIDNVGNHFIGLAAPGTLVADFINDTGTDYSDTSFIGFTRHEDDGDSWDFTYQATGQAFSNIATGIHVPVADTFVKFGFVYDPDAPNARKIKIFVNSVEQSTYITTTLIDTATFPEGEALNIGAATKASSAADRTLSVDWWAGGQIG